MERHRIINDITVLSYIPVARQRVMRYTSELFFFKVALWMMAVLETCNEIHE